MWPRNIFGPSPSPRYHATCGAHGAHYALKSWWWRMDSNVKCCMCGACSHWLIHSNVENYGKLIPFWKDGGHDAMDGLVTGFRLPSLSYDISLKPICNNSQGVFETDAWMDEWMTRHSWCSSECPHQNTTSCCMWGRWPELHSYSILSCNMIAGFWPWKTKQRPVLLAVSPGSPHGFVWKCWVNIPNEIAI